MKKNLRLSTEIFLCTFLMGIFPLIVTSFLLKSSVNSSIERRIEQEAIDIAIQVSGNLNVVSTFSGLLPNREILQSIANECRKRNGAHVVFLNINGLPLINPYPPNTGLQVIGQEKGRALLGGTYTAMIKGDMGRVIRAFAPIYNYDGRQKGVTVVAFLEPDIIEILSQVYQALLITLPIAIAFILLFSFILAYHIKKKLFGMEPIEIATQLSERENILQSVNEAIIATNEFLEIKVANQAALALFPSDAKIIGASFIEVIPEPILTTVMETQQPEINRKVLLNKEILLANSYPLHVKERAVGIVVTLRNMTEIKALADQLTGVQEIVEALRSHTHEFSNKLHVIDGFLQMGHCEEAQCFIGKIAEEKSFLNSILNNIQIPSIKSLLLGKASEAEEKHICFSLDSEGVLVMLPSYFDESSMIIVLGNLIQNAFEAAQDYPETSNVFVSIRQEEAGIIILIRNNGYVIPEKFWDKIFTPGFTTKITGSGYGLYNVKRQIDLAGGEINFNSNETETVFIVTVPFNILE